MSEGIEIIKLGQTQIPFLLFLFLLFQDFLFLFSFFFFFFLFSPLFLFISKTIQGPYDLYRVYRPLQSSDCGETILYHVHTQFSIVPNVIICTDNSSFSQFPFLLPLHCFMQVEWKTTFPLSINHIKLPRKFWLIHTLYLQ